MGYSIRDANAGDFDVVASFLDDFLRRDYFIPHRQLREVLARRYHRTVLAIDEGELLGLGIMTRRSRTLVNLLVSPCERKRGIASALLHRLRVERVRVKTNVSEGNPTEFYLNRGFRLCGEKTGKPHIVIAVVDLDSSYRYV